MTNTNSYVTKSHVAWLVFWTGLAVGVLVLILSYKGSIDTVHALREGCERGNIQRQALYRNTLRDARSRQAVADQFTDPAAAAVIAHQAQGGFADARRLIRIYASVAQTTGSVKQDCDEVYALPFPLG